MGINEFVLPLFILLNYTNVTHNSVIFLHYYLLVYDFARSDNIDIDVTDFHIAYIELQYVIQCVFAIQIEHQLIQI